MRFLKAGILVLVCAFAAHGQRLFQAQNVSGGGGGLTLTNVSPGAQTPSCSANTTTCTVTLTVANGDLPIADVECRDATAAQNPGVVTDSAGNVWSNSIAPAQQSGSYYNREDYVVAAGGITTMQANCGAATVNTTMVVTVYHRTTGSWTFGGATTNAFGASTTATSSNVTPTASIPALVHGYFMNTNNSTTVWTTANSTIRLNQGASDASYLIGSGDQIIASASTSYAASANIASTTNWQAWASWWK